MNAPSFERGVKRCPSPIIFCDCSEPCSQYPDLPTRERVVKHAGMNRAQQTNILLVVLLAVVLLGAWMWTQDQDQKAIARGDYSGCYSQACSSAITNQLTGH